MYKHQINLSGMPPVYGISQNDSLTDEEKELFVDMGILLKYSCDDNRGQIFRYLQLHEGAIFIDPLNHLNLQKNDGGIDLVGRNRSFLQGTNFNGSKAIYEGQEGVPYEYKFAVNHLLRHDMDQPYLVCSLKPSILTHDKIAVRNLVNQTLMYSLDIDPDDLKASSVKKRPTPKEIVRETPATETEFTVYIKDKQAASKRAKKYQSLETNFVQSVPYLLTKNNQHASKDEQKQEIAEQLVSYVHDTIKGTPIEDYLKLWKGDVLINLNNTVDDFPKFEDYRPFEIALLGNNRSFYQGGVYGSRSYYSTDFYCDAEEYVPFRIEKALDLRVGYPSKKACLYIAAHPEFFTERNICEKDDGKTIIEKYIKQFAHSVYLSPDDMDVESYVLGQDQQNKIKRTELDLSITQNIYSPRYRKLEYTLPPEEEPDPPGGGVCIGMEEVRPMLQNNKDVVPEMVINYRYNLQELFAHQKTQYHDVRKAFIRAFVIDAKLMGSTVTNREAQGIADMAEAQAQAGTTTEDLEKLQTKAFTKPVYEDKYKLE